MPAAASRTLTVLSVLSRSEEPLSVSQLTAETGIARASLVRLLDSLAEEGGVRADDAGRYRATLVLWTLGAGTINRYRVREVAYPYLADLSQRIPSHVNLCLPDYPYGWVVESFISVGGRLTSRLLPDARHHLLANAVGRVIAAHEPAHRQEELLRDVPPPRTPYSMTNAEDIAAELEGVKQRGYATIDRENVADVSGFAVPLLDGTERAAGSIGFARSGPLEESFLTEYIPLAVEVAERISWELGWRSGQSSRVS